MAKSEEESDVTSSSSENEDQDDSSSSTDPEPEEEIRAKIGSLVSGREKRSNAGSKMSTLLENYASLLTQGDQDDDAEFYSTTYGGFNEDKEDEDFDSGKEEADDELDSDFDDLDESKVDDEDDTKGDGDDDDEGKKKSTRGKKVKLAYEISAANRSRREKQQQQKEKAAPDVPKEKVEAPTPAIVKRAPGRPRRVPIQPSESSLILADISEGRNLRKRQAPVKVDDDKDYDGTTRAKSPRKRRGRRRGGKGTSDNLEAVKTHWTQEELLEEAKKTERENLSSLKKYEMLELQKLESKKRARKFDKKAPTCYIRHISTSMPLVIHAEDDGNDGGTMKQKTGDTTEPKERMERSFIVFSDEAAFKSAFPDSIQAKSSSSSPLKSKLHHIKKGEALCAMTQTRARYFDPVTCLPYASDVTFKALREAYAQQLEIIYGKELSKSSSQELQKSSSDATDSGSCKRKLDDSVIQWLMYRRQQKQASGTAAATPSSASST